MKKKLFTILFSSLIFSSLIFYACTREGSVKQEVSNLTPEEVGIAHNEVVAAVLNDLWRERIQLFTNEGITKVTSANTRSPGSWISDEYLMSSIISNAEQLYPSAKGKPYGDYARNALSTRGSSQGLSALLNDIPLTDLQQSYIDKAIEIVNKNGSDVNQSILEFADLEKDIIQAMKNTNSSELEPLLYMTSVFHNSVRYWQENLRAWRACMTSEIVEVIPSYALSETRTDPPRGVDSMVPGFYAHPYDPTAFYIVTEDGYIALCFCPEGLFWNPNISMCDWPENVGIDWGNVATKDCLGALGGGYKGGWIGAIIGGSIASIIEII